ncbi:unnamed protein product [Effrenium voratum]|nr:unnamed protein product [Effrenium voratum]
MFEGSIYSGDSERWPGAGREFSPFYDDFGISEEKLKQLAVDRARDTLTKSCTLLDALDDMQFGLAFFLKSCRLPLEAKHKIRGFVRSAEEFDGREVLGLHNGQSYFLHSMACLPAGRLLCSQSFSGPRMSVADHYTRLGCPVAPTAAVAIVTSCEEDSFCEDCWVPLPAEFAVLAPGKVFPCGTGTGYLNEMLEGFDDSFEEPRVYEEAIGFSQEEEDQEEEEFDFFLRKRRIPRHPERYPLRVSNSTPLQDEELSRCASRLDCVHNTGSRIRELLLQGANPTAVLGKALQCQASLTTHMEDLQGDKLCCHHRAHSSYKYADTFSCTMEGAREFLAELASAAEAVALLQAAEKVWSTSRAAKHTVCSKTCLVGRGVIHADPAALSAALEAVPKQNAAQGRDVQVLARHMWRVLQTRPSSWPYRRQIQQLCCREAETEAMMAEEKLARELRAREQRARQREQEALQRERRREQEALRLARERELQWARQETGPRCQGCGIQGSSAFSISQLRKGDFRRRCKWCIFDQQQPAKKARVE